MELLKIIWHGLCSMVGVGFEVHVGLQKKAGEIQKFIKPKERKNEKS